MCQSLAVRSTVSTDPHLSNGETAKSTSKPVHQNGQVMKSVKSSSNHIEELKRAISCRESCSSETLSSLKALLLSSTAESHTAQDESNDPTTTEPRGDYLSRRKTKTAHDTKIGGKGIKPVGQAKGKFVLSVAERKKLAAEVVNAILKSLSLGAANRPLTAPFAAENSSNIAASTQLSGTPPLQTISGNASKPSRRPKDCVPKGQTPLSAGKSDIVYQVECGCLALASLDSLSTATKGGSPVQDMQVELARSAFIGKLLSLEMHNLAFKELCTLHEKLMSSICSSDEASEQPSRSRDKKGRHEEQGIADLIKFPAAVPSDGLLSLIISTQLHALRLVQKTTSQKIMQAMLKNLHPESPCSPVRFIELTATTTDRQARDTVARRFSSLAHHLFAICEALGSNPWKDEDLVIHQDFSMMRMQYCALYILVKSRCIPAVSTSCGDTKQLLRYLVKTVKLVTNHSSEGAPAIYLSTRKTVIEVLQGLHIDVDHPVSCPTNLLPELQSLCRSMMDLASKCGVLQEGNEWATRGYALAQTSGNSAVRLCDWSCRIAELCLRISPQSFDPFNDDGTLYEAFQLLDGHLRGEATELHDLLMSIDCLRRTSRATVAMWVQEKDQEIQQQKALRMLVEVLSLSTRYCLRYLKDSIQKTPNVSPMTCLENRKADLLAISPRLVYDFTLNGERLLSIHKESWTMLEKGLRHCIHLLQDIQSCSESLSSEIPLAMLVQMIINLQWKCLVSLQIGQARQASSLFETFEVFQCSENALALWLSKAQEYAQLVNCGRDMKTAHDICTTALGKYLGSEDFQAAVIQASSMDPQEIWSNSSLRRKARSLLQTHIKLVIKASQTHDKSDRISIEYPMLTPCPSAHGLLLEAQLSILTSLPKEALSDVLERRRYINAICVSLLSIYDYSKFPIRRLRLLTSILRLRVLGSGDPLILESLDLACPHKADIDAINEDVGLYAFQNHLQLMKQVLEILDETGSRYENLGSLFEQLQLNLHANDKLPDSAWSRLAADWIDILEYVSQFCNKEGYWSLLSVTLKTLYRAHEIGMVSSQNARLRTIADSITCSVKCGLVDQAESYVTMGRDVLSSNRIEASPRLRFLISVANYTLLHHDTSQCRIVLKQIEDLTDGLGNPSEMRGVTRTSSYRDRIDTADYYRIHSACDELEGFHEDALINGRLCVKVLYPLWSSVSKALTQSPNNAPNPKSDIDSKIQLEAPREKTSPPQHAREKQIAWLVGPRLIDSFTHLTQLYQFFGVFTEACYYAEQAMQIARALEGTEHMKRTNALLEQIKAFGHQPSQGKSIPESVSSPEYGFDLDNVVAHVRIAETERQRGNVMEAEGLYRSAKALLDHLDKGGSRSTGVYNDASSTDVVCRMAELAISQKRPKTKACGATKHFHAKKQQLLSRGESRDRDAGRSTIPLFSKIAIDILHGEAFVALTQDKPLTASSILHTVNTQSMDPSQILRHSFLSAQSHVEKVLTDISCDLVFSVLPDSALASPSIALYPVPTIKANARSLAISTSRKGRTNISKAEIPVSDHHPRLAGNEHANEFTDTLELAAQEMVNSWHQGASRASIDTLRRFARLSTGTHLMLSSLKTLGSGTLHLLQMPFLEGTVTYE